MQIAQPITLETLFIATTILSGIQALIWLWFTEKYKAKLQRESASIIELQRWELSVRKQAEKIAEYMSIARSLSTSSTPEEYRYANQLAWELALWLPRDIYKSLSHALTSPSEVNNPLSVVVEVRQLLLEEKFGSLTQDEVLCHAPGAGGIRNLET